MNGVHHEGEEHLETPNEAFRRIKERLQRIESEITPLALEKDELLSQLDELIKGQIQEPLLAE